MSPNTTLFQAFPSPQVNSTTIDLLVIIVFGIASAAVSAFIICHGHRTWRLHGNRINDEEHKLRSVPTTDAQIEVAEEHELGSVSRTNAEIGTPEEHELGNVSTNKAELEIPEEHELGSISTTNAGSHVNNVFPIRIRPELAGPSAPTPSGGRINHVELTGGGSMDHIELDDGGENEGAWP